MALNSAGRTADALQVLGRAAQRWPTDHDLLLALATVQHDVGHGVAACATVQLLLKAHPGDCDARALDPAPR